MICSICKQEPEAFSSDVLFIDGRKYDTICHCCAATPVQSTPLDTLGNFSVSLVSSYHNIKSLDQLMGQGWSRRVVDISLKAVKTRIRHLPTIDSKLGQHCFGTLIINNIVFHDWSKSTSYYIE